MVDMELNLSSLILNGLKVVADTSKISDEYFVILLKNTINALIESTHFDSPQGTYHFVCSGGRWACLV